MPCCYTCTHAIGTAKHALRFLGVQPSRCAGFTIIELVLVIVIIGILGVLAGPRFFSNSVFEERAYYNELTSATRYAQKVAVSSGCRVRLDLTATTYQVQQQAALGGHCDTSDTTFPVPVLLANGQTVSGTAPSDVTALPALSIVYDALGRTNLGADQTINVGSWSFSIEAESGLVVTP